MRKLALIAMLFAQAPPLQAQPRDWAALLRLDAQGLHDDIAANHAGPVNALDPDFSGRNDAGLALALERAKRVHSFGGYRAAMAAYAASFDDGHIFWGTNEKAPDAIVSWPSLLTGFDDSGAQIVRSRAKDAPVPLGAVLVGCDGMPANTLAARLVGDFVGRWMLSSQRMQLASLLFANDGNPFVVRPRRCTFRINGSARAVKLHWRVLSGREHAVEPFADPPRQPIGSRIFPDGTRWFSMSSFDGDPGGDVGKALVAMIVQMKQDRPALAAAPRIVLDLRRNGGGSSDWSYQIATILWGAAATDRQAQDGSWAEWRVSPANIDSVIEMRDERAAGGLSPEQLNYLNILIEGMKAAHAAGQPLWREPSDAYAPNANVPADTPPPQPLAGPVYVVTDSDCASACLDAVDLWRRLGAIQVGRETGADTLYLDIRRDTLPSGISSVSVPMKVFRNRPRGSNETVRPHYRFAGDMADEAALERWIAALPAAAK